LLSLKKLCISSTPEIHGAPGDLDGHFRLGDRSVICKFREEERGRRYNGPRGCDKNVDDCVEVVLPGVSLDDVRILFVHEHVSGDVIYLKGS
jgi:hypothetical protein